MRLFAAAMNVLAVLALASCAAINDKAASNVLARQRDCESTIAPDSLHWTMVCKGVPPLPATCKQPGTDSAPECQQWAMNLINGNSAATEGGVAAAIGAQQGLQAAGKVGPSPVFPAYHF